MLLALHHLLTEGQDQRIALPERAKASGVGRVAGRKLGIPRDFYVVSVLFCRKGTLHKAGRFAGSWVLVFLGEGREPSIWAKPGVDECSIRLSDDHGNSFAGGTYSSSSVGSPNGHPVRTFLHGGELRNTFPKSP